MHNGYTLKVIQSWQRGILSSKLALFFLVTVLASPLDSVIAQATKGAASKPLGPLEVFFQMIPMFAIVFMIVYFMVIRPQKTEQDLQTKLYEGLKKGDQVVTSGGVIGRVFVKNDYTVTLELENSARVRVERKHIVKFFEKGDSKG